MSLDYEFVPIDVSILTHPKACAAGVEAMGLWLWGMAYAKHQRTGGLLHRTAVLAAWGGRRNIMLAKRLIESGLWLAREDGDWDIHNFERKGPGSKGPSAERMRRLRERRRSDAPPSVTSDVTAVTPDPSRDANSVTLCSTSLSDSVSSSSPGEHERVGNRTKPTGPPPWFAVDALAIIEMNAADVLRDVGPVGERWVQYLGAMQRGKQPNAAGAASWLTSTVRAERAEAQAKAERRKPFEPPPKPIAQTRAEAIDFANELSRRMGLKVAGGP